MYTYIMNENSRTFDPADDYARRTIILAGADSDEYDPEEEAYWESLLTWVDSQ